MNGRFLNSLALAVVTLALIGTGCRQDMHDQPKFKGYRGSGFFPDKRSVRPVVEDTVARGQLREDERFYTGKQGGTLVTELPMPLTRELLGRGRERYDIFCAPCHDRVGGGLGMVVRRGYRRPSSLHTDRLRESPVGYFYDVMTSGFGAMADYAAQLPPGDRWAVAAYIRALQLSQRATQEDVPGDELVKLSALPAPTPGPEVMPHLPDWNPKGDDKPAGPKEREKH